MGYYVSGNEGPMEEVLISRQSARKFAPDEVRGKIFHFFACHTGSAGTTIPYLGQAMIVSGAVAFFGYSDQVQMHVPESAVFCDCDIAVDKALMALQSCDDAYRTSIDLYDKSIARFRANGDHQAAARLEHNRNALVAPSTIPMYGDKTARLEQTTIK